MSKIVTSDFKTHNAKQFVESLSETANSIYYVTIGKHTAFPDDATPPVPSQSLESSFYQLYRDMIYGKQVKTSDIRHMIDNYPWTSGTVYTQYDHTVDLSGEKFFVVVQEEGGDYSVFKCLFNNKGAPSTDKPVKIETSADDDIYVTTGDSYQWKYMFTIPESIYNKFSTSDKVPVVADANVEANAISGSIDVVDVKAGGSRYFSVANGVVKVAAVAANDQIIELESLAGANLNITTSNGTFQIEKIDLVGKHANGDPDTTNNVANAIAIEANSTFLRVTDIKGDFFGQTSNVYARGVTSNAFATISSITKTTSTLSANTDFYKGSTFYITAGAGAGQAKTISEYVVTGSARRIVIPSAFATTIDTTSLFEITPRVVIAGDGQGASGRAIVNASTFAIDTIEMTDRGYGYSYATALVLGNTGISSNGITLQANNANVVPIISPKGGHGSDPVSELKADTVGISVDFANSQGGQIPAVNDFRQVSILKDPLFANVVLSISDTLTSANASGTGTSFTDGETVVQGSSNETISKANVTIANTNGTFQIEEFTLYGANSTGSLFHANNDPAGTSNVITTGVIVNVDGSVLTLHNANVAAIDAYDKYSNGDFASVLVGTESSATGQVDILDNKADPGGAYGIVSTRAAGSINLSNVYGQFVSSGSNTELRITGLTSGTTANLVSFKTNERAGSNFDQFDQRVRLTGFENSSSLEFQIDERIVQDETDAEGVIHSINTSSGATILAITNKKGNLAESEGTDPKYVRGQDSEAVGYFTDEAGPDIQHHTGEILYVENITPITRSDDQTERVKLMIKF